MQDSFSIQKSNSRIHRQNTLKKKNNMITSIDADKAFDKLQQLFVFKKKKKNNSVNYEWGGLPPIDKVYLQKTHSSHHTKWWETRSISTKMRNKTSMSPLTTLFQYCTSSTG